ncbi:2-amino-4-hydroxy-6-hydroxymethyldihydropteridine diphosphokinase [Rhizobacter sp. SG703]|nr:2-amino-4-hydroxy-6-hydroxymethyldihydropteridine diphosphokinase [Rhizobacter sp. SG703]
MASHRPNRPASAVVVAASPVALKGLAALPRPSAAMPANDTRAEWAFVGLGANLGDAHATLSRALDELAALPGVESLQASPLYRSKPVDAQGPDFVNAVARLRTTLSPLALLAGLQAIEAAHGRERPYRNAPRTLDLDLLLYGEQAIDEPTLTVPHPRMHLRAFVLAPLADLAPDLQVPGRGGVAELLAGLDFQPLSRIDP